MRERMLPRLQQPIGEVGVGTWGMGGWTGSNDRESAAALDRAVERGCTFFDTAWAYGDGHSERLLGALVARWPERRLFIATKVPPKNRQWPGRASTPAEAVYPADHIVEYARSSLRNLSVASIDLLQLHVWDDAWCADGGWQEAAAQLKASGQIRAFGISVNRWEPHNVLAALETGLVDAVQVVYNVFEQRPEDVLFPECRARGVAVIARVPLDEGSLTGTLTADSRWPEGDWRNRYFTPADLAEILPRVERLETLAGQWRLTLPELALRFGPSNPDVTTVIPGMRTSRHVDANLEAAANGPLSDEQLEALREHRWDRMPSLCP